MTEYGAHVFNTFDDAAMSWAHVADLVGDPEREMHEANYNHSKEELAAYIQSLEDKLVPEGFKVVPIEPTEEMIQAACLGQSYTIHETYQDWANSCSNGVVEMIRKFEAESYINMLGAYKHEF